MAASTKSRVPITPANVAFLLFDQQLYSEYLEFQNSIVLPRHQRLYKTREDWIAARDASQRVPRGHLPVLLGYKAFMYWLHECGKLFTVHDAPTADRLMISKVCGHPIHPAVAPRFHESTACPVCTIEQATSALSRAWRAWKALGAPDRSAPYDLQGISCELYHTLKSIWRFEKKRWVGLVLDYEELSKVEVEWEEVEAQNPVAISDHTLEELKEAKSARTGLQFARANDPHRTDSAEIPFVPGPVSNRHAHSQPCLTEGTVTNEVQEALGMQNIQSESPLSRELPSPPHSPVAPISMHTCPPASSRREPSSSTPSLVFSPPHSPGRGRKVVKFDINVLDNKSRSGNEFKRTCGSYSPGRYACPSKRGWADTSFSLDHTFEYDNELDEPKEHQKFLAWFAPRREDSDPTVDEDMSDTESDTDSSSSCSDSDSDNDTTDEPGEFEDPLAEAAICALEMEMDPAEHLDHTTNLGIQEEPKSDLAPSGDLEILDAVSGLADAALKSYLSSSGLCPNLEIAEQGLHMVDDTRSLGGTLQSYPLVDATGTSGGQDEEMTQIIQPAATTHTVSSKDDICPDSEAAEDCSEMIKSPKSTTDPDSGVRASIIDMAHAEQNDCASATFTLGRRVRTVSDAEEGDSSPPTSAKRHKPTSTL